MHVGLFVNTPAHAHLYREVVHELRRRGHEATIFARDDSCTLDILDYHEIAYHMYGQRTGGRSHLAKALPGQLRTIKRLVRQIDLDLVIGMGVYSTYAGAIADIPAIALLDSEPLALKQRVTAPIVDAFLTPASFRRDLGSKHYLFRGFKETAYLHPEVFRPIDDIQARLDIDASEPFTLVRFNAFNGHHDVGKTGFTAGQKQRLLELLADHGTVLVSDEGDGGPPQIPGVRAFDAHPALIHDALSGADLLIADTQTMVTEAGLLGTPAIRSNSFVGPDDMGNFGTLEDAGLVHNLEQFSDVVDLADRLLSDPDTDERYQRRREAFIQGQCNLTALIVDLIEDAGKRGQVRAAVDAHAELSPARARIAELSAD